MKVHLTSVMSFPPETSHKPQWAQLYTAFQLEKKKKKEARSLSSDTSRWTQASLNILKEIHLGHQKLSVWAVGNGRGDTYIGEGNWHLCADTNYFYHIPFICLSLAVMDPRNASKTVSVPILLIVGWLSYLCWSGKPEQQCSKHVFPHITAVNAAITGSDLTAFKLKHLGLL